MIGPSFVRELRAAGLGGLPFSWGPDGVFYSPKMTAEQIAAVEAVLAAHDPTAGALTKAELMAATRKKAAELRLPIANILSDLQIDALVSADQAKATTIKGLKDGLAAIVNMDLSAYDTAEQMEYAVLGAYLQLAATAPAQLKQAFQGLVP